MQRTPGATYRRPHRLSGTDGPQILPVTYQFRNGSVIFRTSPVGPLSGLIRRTSVAFEIDSIDEQNKSGWSVLVLGFAEAMAHNYLLPRPGRQARCHGLTEPGICSLRSSHARSVVAPCDPLRAIDIPNPRQQFR